MLVRRINLTHSYRLFNKLVNKQSPTLSTLCKCNNISQYRWFKTDVSRNNENVTNRSSIMVSGGMEKNSSKFPFHAQQSSLSSEELLEKMFTVLSADIHQKRRVYKNDLIKVINKVKELKFSSNKQGLLLIKCCGDLLVDETPSTRMDLLEQVGDINQATEVISNMKARGLPATEHIFCSLIVCQGKSGNLNNIQEVLTMMKSLKLNLTINTYTATVRAYIFNKKDELVLKEMHKAQQSGLQFDETHIMNIVKTLASVSLYELIPKVLKYLPEDILKTPSITPYMQSVATSLVYQNHPMAALEIYKCLPIPSFGPKDDQGLHGRSLVRDCVRASMGSSIIGLIAQELMSSGRNPIALQNACETALRLGKVPLALDLLTRMKQLGMPIRPHYFWPILLHTSKTYGEKGIMNTLSTMMMMEVRPDYETIMTYTLPYVSFTSPQNLMKKFQDAGLSATTVLTPMMETLLNTGQVRAASEICELFEGKVDTEILLRPLVKGYLISLDVKSTIHILEDVTAKAIDKNKDWVGRFLCVFIKHKKVKVDLSDFMAIIQALKGTSLKISTTAADYCMTRLPDTYDEATVEKFKRTLIDITDEKLVDDNDMFVQQMPHPKNMNEESLRAHLCELEAKNMNTRGVLRKLLLQYCKENNLKAALEIVDKCQKEGVFLSAGMKAAIFDLHVKLGELESAELVLNDLNKTFPNFTLDEFKLIDFATLMVYKNKIKQACELINEHSKKKRVVGGRSISMNCWRLLDAVAAQGTAKDTQRMFELLTSLRYCKPTNTILGPLIRVHLKNNNLEVAVQEFENLASKYSSTPMKHELLCNILTAMGDGGSEDTFIVNEKRNSGLNKLVQRILSVNKKVHGSGDVQLTLIAALTEVGYKKTLRRLLLDPTVKFHPDALLRRCERFADEKKVVALEMIADCIKDLRLFDVEEIYNLILDVYQRDNDCQEGLALWYKMQDADVTPSQKFIRNLCSLCISNKREIPSDLEILLDKHNKKATST
ncbi:leucine-rich PPR motif-containing protein, mitochondrial isoform X2 [Battus philenor]|uniref:leucine-rich PPR motif-containing protein, mitochondrial isoform X2 n=1 Tax=Battus philenor TaxID=42288 RepID=UPI0035CFF1B3